MNQRKYKLNSKQKSIEITVIIPCYNEAQTIQKVVNDFKRILPEATIYVYDNNSTDGTDTLAKDVGAVVRYEAKQGKGNVIRRAFREIEADCYLLVDGDDTYPADNAVEMIHIILEEHADMVIGDRLSDNYFNENKRPFHNVGNRLVRFLINRIFHSEIQDIMSGYRAFSRKFVKTFPVLCKGFEIETEMTIHGLDKNLHIREVPIRYRNRPEGSISKLKTFRDGFKVLSTIAQLYRFYRPFAFFGLLSVFMCIFSVVLFFPVFVDYLKTGFVDRFPTLIVCGFLFLGAMLSFFSGLILDTLIRTHKHIFELFLLQNETKQ